MLYYFYFLIPYFLFLLDPFFEQLKQNIVRLIADGKPKEAYEKAKQLLAQYPEDDDVREIYEDVVKEIAEENDDKVNEALPALKEAYANGEFEKVLQETGKLLKFAPKHGDLRDLYFDAQKAYQKKLEQSLDLMKDRYRKRFDELLEKSPHLLNEELFALDMANPTNEEVLHLTAEYRDHLIEKMIREKEELIYSDKTEALEHFLKSLQQIDPKSKRVEDLRRMIRMAEGEAAAEDRLEFMYRGEQHLKTLLRLKKYDKALKVAEEILVANPKSGYAKRGAAEARRKLYAQSREAAVKLLLENLPQLEADRKANPDNYLSV